MRRIDSSLAVAIGVSLCVHVALGVAFVHYAMTARLTISRTTADEPIEIIPDIEPDPAIDEPLNEFTMGEATGSGYASHQVDSPVEATAREADLDQAFLSLDPSGAGGKGSDAAVSEAKGTGANRGQPSGTPSPLDEELAVARRPSPAAFGVKSELKLPQRAYKVGVAPIISDAPAKVPTAGQEGEAVASLLSPAAAAFPAQAPSPSAGSTSAGTGQPAADPARMSDSESDPFSRLGSAEFRDGALKVSFGRKVKTRTPKLLLGAQEDLFILRDAKIVLKIDIDATGKVTGVNIVKSTGSNAIDQPTRVAVYDWWFEPRKDDDGHSTPDQVQFTIAWR
jgi:TonB family protein